MILGIFCPAHSVARFFVVRSMEDAARAIGEWQGREHPYEPCLYGYWHLEP